MSEVTRRRSSLFSAASWVSELRFSCDRAYLGELMVSLYFAGSGVGAWGFGKVADARGRLPVAKAMAALLIVCQLLSAAASQVWWLAVLRFGTGVGVGGQLSSAYNLLVEQVGELYPDHAYQMRHRPRPLQQTPLPGGYHERSEDGSLFRGPHGAG